MAQPGRGHYKIFLGMAAGVGKTYRMLQEGQAEKADGRDVVVGILETHGREDTAAQAEGLEIIPPRRVEYRGSVLEEMDLPAIFQRAPELCLIDELAHTNAPGLEHAKRYQDIEDVLDAGVDVYSTVNVQHLESLNDRVAELCGVRVRETFPDQRARLRGRGRPRGPDSRGARPASARGQGLPAGPGPHRAQQLLQDREPVRPARGGAAPGGRGGGVEAPRDARGGARHTRGAAARAMPRLPWPSTCWLWSRPTRDRSGSCGGRGVPRSGSAASSTCSTSGRPASPRVERSASDSRSCAGSARCSARR